MTTLSSPAVAVPRETALDRWWRTAVVYQVYPRSFADGDGDGTGDLAGVRSRLPYLASLGVDALWFTPWYASPLADGGYDVADYRAIDPAFGTLAEAEALIAEAREHGIRTIVDVVPNHVSDQHAWFTEAVAAGPGSPQRQRFWFREGRGEHGERPPTDWPSTFGGPAWTRVTEPDGRPGEWYLHLFASEQPDLNWGHPDVRREHEDVLRFWFDRGVAGVRIDSATMPVKDPALPELSDGDAHPFVDRDEVHRIYRSWRAVADSYPEKRVLIGEVWLDDPARFARYLRPDEMHSAFNFDFMRRPWDARQLRASIAETLASHRPVAAAPTWVLSNHDVTRPVTRYGREDSSFLHARTFGVPTDLALGHRRARAAALLSAALPGSLYIYQGDELGLPEVDDLPAEARQDPVFHRTGGADPGRDGCRVPLPWKETGVSHGFSVDPGATAWLPQPPEWRELSVQRQEETPTSMLALYRATLELRRTTPALAGEEFAWLDTPEGVLGFRRGDDFACLVNFSAEPQPLPRAEVLLSSGELVGRSLPADTAVWVRLQEKEGQ
ncbi:glycoside hydrolase family 13 protein [Amycolatopsis sp. NPDC098790]|uniref:glycoside hydrolase family 13 protein n=1 Tax=Amycolatopsis sp. NPDC098790 TaxID=3363939 RepID=UPI0037F7F1D5